MRQGRKKTMSIIRKRRRSTIFTRALSTPEGVLRHAVFRVYM
jgi:hypothetical protein